MKDEKDSNLIRRFKEGDEKAFNQLVVNYQRRVYDLIYRMVRNHQDAADLSMEVFVRAYRSLRSFEGRSSLYVWLARIAVNLCINFSKREKFRHFLSIFDLEEKLPASGSAAGRVEKEELRLAIDRAVKSLPPRQRSCFVLKSHQGLTHQEIAEVLGISEGASKANYFQAIRKLRKLLAHCR